MEENKLTEIIIGKAIEVHKQLGPGLLETAYQECLFYELRTVEFLNDVHTVQIITYMKLGNYNLGLLLNFHVKLLKNGIRRFKY